MALGSPGSWAVASSSQAANSRNGSSAVVKSPDVNQLGCSIGLVSDIVSGVSKWPARRPVARPGGPLIVERLQQAYGAKRRSGLAGVPPLAAILLLGMLTGGCAVSGMFGIAKDDAMAKAETTGSIPPTSGRLSSGLPPEADLVLARAAIAEVLSMRRKDFSTSWENPSTGARGTVTPIAAAYQQDGVTCHDFLASYLNGRAETWMRGEACQQPQGQWEVKVLRPWKRS